MKKLLVSTSIAAVFALSGCGGSGETLDELRAEAPVVKPASRMVFDPTAGKLPIPTDFLFAVIEQTDDGTLEMPDEIEEQMKGTLNFGNPGTALGGIDGWSSQHPFTFATTHPAGVTLDKASAEAPGAVRMFRGALGGNQNDPDCATAPPLSGCKIYEELQYGVDFVSTARGNDLVVVPRKPLVGSNQYFVVITDSLKGSDGRSVAPSSSYLSLSQDINTLPLATESQLALQGLINSYEAVVSGQGGVSQDSIIFAHAFTVQSNEEIIDTVKKLQIAPFATAYATALGQGADQATALAAAGQFLPAILVNEGAVPTAFDVLAERLLGADTLAALTAVGLNSCDGLISAVTNPVSPLFSTAAGVFPQVGAYCAADLKQGSIDLPYYLSATDPLAGRWTAACTNGLALQALGAENIAGLLQSGTITAGPNNDVCQAASEGVLLDLDLTNLGISDLRHLTRFSPIPARQGSNPDGTESIAVQLTVPDPAVVAVLSALPGSTVEPISKPEGGWPVVILQHGITSKKEDLLAVTGALSIAGYATIAIDHPLHGSRGFVIDEQVINTSAGFGGKTTDYFNLSSLLTARDNLRQSIVDTMGLRLGLNALVDLTGGSADINGSKVSFIGQSLGSISGIPTVSVSNKSLGGQLAGFDGMYAIETAVFSVPGGGIAGFLMESPSFGSLIKGSLLSQASTDFQQFLAGFAAQNGLTLEEALAPAYDAFAPMLDAEQSASVAATFAEFTFAAQTILDAGDPNNYAALLGSNTTTLLHEVVGGGQNDDGSTASSDQVIPNSTVNSASFAGTEPLALFIGLDGVSTTQVGENLSGIVRFITGSHSSLADPSASLAATTEMQTQAAGFIKSGGTAIVVTNEDVVAN